MNQFYETIFLLSQILSQDCATEIMQYILVKKVNSMNQFQKKHIGMYAILYHGFKKRPNAGMYKYFFGRITGTELAVGTMFDASSNYKVYEGMFLRGRPHGHCTQFYESGIKKYSGEYEEGSKIGMGICYDSSGRELYIGRLYFGKHNGNGVIIKRDSSSKEIDKILISSSSGYIIKCISSVTGQIIDKNCVEELLHEKWTFCTEFNLQSENVSFLYDVYRERLVRFYEKYNPVKLPHVETFMGAWKEDELFKMLTSKYGPEPECLE